MALMIVLKSKRFVLAVSLGLAAHPAAVVWAADKLSPSGEAAVSGQAQPVRLDNTLDRPPQIRLGADPAGPSATDYRLPGLPADTPASSAQDEILLLLRQSDPDFSGNRIALPQISIVTEGETVPDLTLRSVLDLALGNSYSFAATAAQADQARYAAKATAGQLGPTLDLRAQKGNEYSSPSSVLDPNTGQIQRASYHKRWDVTLIGRQPIFAPGSYYDYRKSSSLADAADLRRDDARENLYYNAIKAYYDVMRAYATLSFSRSYAQRMGSLLDYMSKRLEGGGASRIDFERVRGRSLTAQSAVAEAEGALESAMVSLNQITGRKIEQIEVPDHMMPVVPDTSKLALQDIYETNPGVRAARRDVDAANLELKSARAKFSPTLAVEWTQTKTRGAGGAIDTTDNSLQLTTDRRLMMVVTMNLLNGGSDVYYSKQAGAKYVEKSNTALDLERKLREQIEINYRTLGAVRKRMEISRQAYLTNANVADVFLEQLSTGSKQLLDVLDAYQQAYQARMDFANLLFQQADISYQILRNTGRASALETLPTRASNKTGE
ncbi:outer membrane protein [Herbaspirillum rubrisubalbicans M1]|uniref:TolC family protein n=1 Tax=Herbaspirillum rubrisubalbicans TaxID=80842 RepID=UPI00073A02AF|nr:TolC family protein [Herbaspirillum rubrisubalbicans]ALU88880.1 outer membrane protein [Herbaspirillum rubrisubalbicans M1]